MQICYDFLMDCLFCNIIRRAIPSNVVYEDERTFAFLDIRPLNPGHTLVIPKTHSLDIFEMPDEDLSAVIRTVRKIALGMEKAFAPDGVNVHMNNRRAAGQVVFHAHIHVIPRHENDGYAHWHGSPLREGEGAAIAKSIRRVL